MADSAGGAARIHHGMHNTPPSGLPTARSSSPNGRETSTLSPSSGDDTWTIPRKRPLLQRWFGSDRPRYSPTVAGTRPHRLTGAEQLHVVDGQDFRPGGMKRSAPSYRDDTKERRPNVAWSADERMAGFRRHREDRDDTDERIIVRRHDGKDTRELILYDSPWNNSNIQTIRWSPNGPLAEG